MPTFAMERPEAVRIFGESVEAYKNGQIERSVELGEELVAAGFVSPGIYFNLGNAYIKTGQLGRAVLNYRRAERLAPRDADLRVNLDLARGQVEGVSGGPSGGGIPSLLRLQRMTTREIRWAALLLFMAASGFCLLGLFLGIKKKRLVAWTLFLGFFWVLFTAAGVVRTVNEAGLAVVVEGAEARFEPLRESTTYFRLPEGNEVHVLREQEGWSKIERPDGKTGWVPSAAATRI